MMVLVTGHLGFVGSFLVPALEGFQVRGYDAQEGDDILDAKRLFSAMKGCDAVVHLAAIPHFTKDHTQEDYWQTNVRGSMLVIHAAEMLRVPRVVYASSGAVYGFGPEAHGWKFRDKGWLRKRDLPFSERTEGHNLDLVDFYGASKRIVEALAWRVEHTSVFALRFNGIEPWHERIRDEGFHWGWWCSQRLLCASVRAALRVPWDGFVAVNVGEPNENMRLSRLATVMDVGGEKEFGA